MKQPGIAPEDLVVEIITGLESMPSDMKPQVRARSEDC